MLEGKNIRLRAIDKQDIEVFLKWFNDLEITQNLLLIPPISREAEEKWIAQKSLSGTDIIFTIDLKGNDGQLDEPIGNCGFHEINWRERFATVGIAIGEKEHWGNGYGTEAYRLLLDYGFRILNLHRISSSVFSFNQTSIRLHERVGFKNEGCRRKAFFRKGRYCDEILYGILQSEWKKLNK